MRPETKTKMIQKIKEYFLDEKSFYDLYHDFYDDYNGQRFYNTSAPRTIYAKKDAFLDIPGWHEVNMYTYIQFCQDRGEDFEDIFGEWSLFEDIYKKYFARCKNKKEYIETLIQHEDEIAKEIQEKYWEEMAEEIFAEYESDMVSYEDATESDLARLFELMYGWKELERFLDEHDDEIEEDENC